MDTLTNDVQTKEILIVVDYQNDFVDGALGFSGAEKLAPVIAHKMVDYHRRGQRIVQTFDVHGDDYLQTREGLFLPVEHCIVPETVEFDAMVDTGAGMSHYLREAMAEIQADKENGLITPDCVLKHSFGSMDLANALNVSSSIFNGTVLAQWLRYDRIELCGLVSYLCVLSNAILVHAAQPEAEILIDVQAIAGPDEQLHHEALDIMRAMGFTVYDSKENEL
jgi:nicotinamidase-related amidase